MVDIIIVNWNSGTALQKCIESIINSDNFLCVNQIIISDNHSSDESMRTIQPGEKIKKLIHSKNLGFAAAVNIGLQHSSAAFILILNPDTMLLPGNLAQCESFIQRNKHVSILGCQLLNDQGNITVSCSRFPTVSSFFIQSLGLHKIAPGLFKPPILMTDFDHKSSRNVHQVMGAFMFMSSDIVKRYGYFDERFFVYYEDVDFSVRVAQQGGITYFNASIKAIHSGMGTTSGIPALRLFYNLRSKHLYAKKHFSYVEFLLVKLFTYTTEIFSRFLMLIFSRNFTSVVDLLQTYKMLLFKKRKEATTSS